MSAKGMLAPPQTTLKNVSTLDHRSSTTIKEDGNDFCVRLNPSEAVTACAAGHSGNGGAATAKPMSIEPEVTVYTDCNIIHLEVSQPAVSGDKVSLPKTDAGNALKTHNDPMKYNVCIDDELVQARETDTRATTMTNQRADPVSFPCKECGWEKSLALYAPSYHTMYYNEKILNMAFQVTTFDITMKCRSCEGERVRELQCKGACHLLKTLDEFTKEQRILGTNLCLDCLSACKSTALHFPYLAAAAPDNSKAYKNKSDVEKNNNWPMYPAKQALSIDDLKAEVGLYRELVHRYQVTHAKLKKAFRLLTLFMIILLLVYSTANLSMVLFWPDEIKSLPTDL